MLPAAVDVPPDPTLDLAKVVGVAIAFGTADRDALFEVARRVIEGPDRFAQRLGFTVASAIIAAMHDLPPVPMPADASELPLAGGDRQGRGARIT